jgi:hypothetical protein
VALVADQSQLATGSNKIVEVILEGVYLNKQTASEI